MENISNVYFKKDDDDNDLPDTDGITIIMDNGDRLWVPSNLENRHWQMYQAWLTDGNTTQSE